MKDLKMTAGEYQQYLKQNTGNATPAKIQTRVKKGRVARTEAIDADQFRRENVDQNEHKIQVQCVDWFDLQYPGLLLYAIPNGGKRGKATAVMLKAEGVRRGIPDLKLSVVTNEFPGLYIETKTPTGNLKPEQAIAHAYLRAQGYVVAVVRSLEEFQAVITDYLNGN